jgi:hypothetical protein
LLGFLLPSISKVPALVPNHSSKRSLVSGRFFNLSAGAGDAVLL